MRPFAQPVCISCGLQKPAGGLVARKLTARSLRGALADGPQLWVR